MVNKVFGNEPNMLPEDFNDLNLTLGDLDNDLIICFPQPPRVSLKVYTLGWVQMTRKKKKKTKGDNEDEREGEDKAAGPGACAGDGLGANN
ncbi:hypothetical protein D8674_000237 [Pyrus ussuriensis x Pyrus communis]|uniref:Uncharacterized protein n=1 Tax=Pyrus ussuriensis x Pyrus communis TaxID=2448454 RepID=A0A5N5F2X0_9ROSA|nr:hypothetical protein D8674_000237 [Pyrus ussuriensis x Pyrus communis]